MSPAPVLARRRPRRRHALREPETAVELTGVPVAAPLTTTSPPRREKVTRMDFETA